MYIVYVIGLPDDVHPPYNNCYIGVTSDKNKRWNMHKKSGYTVGRFIRHFDLSIDQHMHTIYEGNRDECFAIEQSLRPRPFMGLNEAIGGRGGDTGIHVSPPKWSYTPERAKKISDALKGRKKTKEHVRKVVDNRDFGGAKNPAAKRWVLTSPDGIEYHIHGNLREMCLSLNLLESSLRYYKGSVVPPAKMKDSVGGYRAKNTTSLERRMNTEGWMLTEASTEEDMLL